MTWTRRSSRAATLALLVVLTGCSWSNLDDGSAGTVASIPPSSTIAEEMRPVPTVPPATVAEAPDPAGSSAGQVAGADDEGGASGAQGGASGGTESTPATAVPTTELVGDPQPNPDSGDTLPPLPGGSPVVEACELMNQYDVVDLVGQAAGASASVESIPDDACRITAGPIVAEVHFVSEATVNDDWFRRDGIEPVGEVGGDAVGLATFTPPGSPATDGYTIALLSRRRGAIVAVRGTDDARSLASQLATFAGDALA